MGAGGRPANYGCEGLSDRPCNQIKRRPGVIAPGNAPLPHKTGCPFMIQAMLLSVLVVSICTAIHYLVLKRVSDTIAHVIEAFIYTLFFLWAVQGLQIGALNESGPAGKPPTMMDYFYFSLVNFTTLGRGDLTPMGHLRFITGIEAFHGFLMITASGSFVLQVMAGRAPLSDKG